MNLPTFDQPVLHVSKIYFIFLSEYEIIQIIQIIQDTEDASLMTNLEEYLDKHSQLLNSVRN